MAARRVNRGVSWDVRTILEMEKTNVDLEEMMGVVASMPPFDYLKTVSLTSEVKGSVCRGLCDKYALSSMNHLHLRATFPSRIPQRVHN